jgi:hypothetical protein
MPGHLTFTQSITRRILAPIAAAVALLALPLHAWGSNNVTISNNTFPSIPVGSSETQNVTLTYTGSTPVVISSIVLQSAGAGGNEYTLNSISGCHVGDGTSSPTGTVCTLNVTYKPAFPGSLASPMYSRNATLVATDSVNGKATFGLAGAASGAIGQVVPGTISLYAGLPYTDAGSPPLPQNNGLGQGPSGYIADGVPAISTKIEVGIASYSGQPMALDSAGNLYFVDNDDSIIRMIDNTANHVVTTVSGTPKTAGSSGTSGEGGLATAAKLTTPYSMALDSAGNIYFTNYSGQDNSGAHYFVLRKVHAGSGLLTSVAGQNFNGSTYGGSGTCPTSNPTSWQCGDGGQAADAELKSVTNFVIDGSGNIYLWEGLGGYLREINAATGVITTVATAAQLNVNPANNSNGGITLAADGNIYFVVMDQTTGYAAIREYNTSTQAITLLAGNISSGTAGCVTNPTTIQGGGPLNKLFLSGISPLTSDASGNLYLTTNACSSPSVYRINLNSQMAYPLLYDYDEWGIADTGMLAGTFNAFYGYYVNPTFAIPDNAGNLYFFNWYGQIGLLSGSNAELSYPFVFPPNTPPQQYDFNTSADQIVTYANVGNANQPIPVYSLAAGTNFTVDTNPPSAAPYCTPANTLATGTTCNIYLQFTPTQVGAVSDTLNIGSADGQTVTLNGSGEANPQMQFSQNSLDFGNQTINIASTPRTLTISNSGTATLKFWYTPAGTNWGLFTIKPVTCVVDINGDYPVAVGSSCTLQVTYKPGYVENDSAYIQFNSNINGSVNNGTQIPLTGSGTAAVVQPAASLNPTTLGFPSTAAGATAQLTTTLSQTATGATMSISGINITGTNAANFTIDSASGCHGVANIVGIGSCTIIVDFKPTTASNYSATLNVANNATGSPQTVTLTGTGTAAAAPLANLNPSPLAFAATAVGSTIQLKANLQNQGNAPLILSGIGITGSNASNFTIDSATTCTSTATVAVSGSCSIIVDFKPTSAASFSATLSVTDNAPGSPHSISLNGTGTPSATVATPQVSPGTGTFSNYGIVTITDATPNAVICYTTTSGSTPAASNGVCTTGSTYSGSFNMSAGLSIQAIGTLAGDTNSAIATATYTLQAAPPTLTPPGGTYVGAQSVTLSTTTTGATIYYTTDGSTPTGSAPSIRYNVGDSSTPIAVTTSGTVINAITIDDGMRNSTVSTGTYTLQFPAVSLTAPSTFTANTGTTSAAQAATLQNTGTAPLTNIVASLTGSNPSDFAITTGTNACGTTLAAGSSCSIYITFTPAAASSFTATLSVADNAANTPQTAALSGTGATSVVSTFVVVSPTPTQIVQPGGAATYTINVNPLNGSYTGAVTLTASGLPTGATASFSPNPVTPGSAGTTSTMTVQTQALVASARNSVWPVAVPALALIGLFLVPGKRHRRWLTLAVLLTASLSALTAFSGCGGGFLLPGSAYTITVNGANSSGAIVSTTTVQLTVQ